MQAKVVLSFIFGVSSLSFDLRALPVVQPASFSDFLRDPETQKTLDRLTRAQASDNEVTLLHLGRTSKPKRFESIANAKHHIWIVIPYWFGDDTGKEVFKALEARKASDPQIEYRIMEDWTSPGSTGDFWGTKMYADLQRLSDGNALQWNPPHWARDWSLDIFNNRIHHKFWIVDGTKLIMGGMNIAHEYLEGGVDSKGWHDTDVMIEGPAVQDAARYFIREWQLADFFEHQRLEKIPQDPVYQTQFFQKYFYEELDPISFGLPFTWGYTKGRYGPTPPHQVTRNFRTRTFLEDPNYFPPVIHSPEQKSRVRIIIDNPLVDHVPVFKLPHFSKVKDTLEFLFAHARQQVTLFIPYLTITDEFEKLLIRTARSRVPVRILTNSLKSHDIGDIPYFGAASHYEALTSAGVKIYEWQGHQDLLQIEQDNSCQIKDGWPGRTIHTKVVVVDKTVAMVGSHNLNTRSEVYNTETMALIEDTAIATRLDQIFDEDLDADPIAHYVDCGEMRIKRKPKAFQVDGEKIRNLRKTHQFTLEFLKNFSIYM